MIIIAHTLLAISIALTAAAIFTAARAIRAARR